MIWLAFSVATVAAGLAGLALFVATELRHELVRSADRVGLLSDELGGWDDGSPTDATSPDRPTHSTEGEVAHVDW